jgi:hypothetical protein
MWTRLVLLSLVVLISDLHPALARQDSSPSQSRIDASVEGVGRIDFATNFSSTP